MNPILEKFTPDCLLYVREGYLLVLMQVEIRHR